MHFGVCRPITFHNLQKFKEHLEKVPKGAQPQKRCYPILVNRETGEMLFAQKISSLAEDLLNLAVLQTSQQGNWQKSTIIASSEGGIVSFCLVNEKGAELDVLHTETVAGKVVKETLRFLNQNGTAPLPADDLPEARALRDLSGEPLLSKGPYIDDHPLWKGNITRFEAEKLLEGRPVGTSLIREADSTTLAMAFHLEEANNLVLRVYVLSSVAEKERVEEVLLLQTERGWAVYRDDPDLQEALYQPTLLALLQQFKLL